MSCHSQGATDPHHASHIWTVAGTVYDQKGNTLEGALVLITDAAGHQLTLRTNGAGNFYTGEPIETTQPLKDIQVEYRGKAIGMPWQNGPSGACNSCHVPSGRAGLLIYAPTD